MEVVRSKLMKVLLVGGDILFIQISMLLALILRFGKHIPPAYQQGYRKGWFVVTACMLSIFTILRLYNSLWRYASVRECLQVISACIIGDLMLMALGMTTGTKLDQAIYIIYPLVLIPFIMMPRFGYRFLRRVYFTTFHQHHNKKKVMVVGAGEAASIIIKEMNAGYQKDRKVVVAVDDSSYKQGERLHGVPIKGSTQAIPHLVKEEGIQEIIIAMPSTHKKRLTEILELCNETQCKLRIFPGIDHALSKAKHQGVHDYIRDVKVEDLLGREEIVMNHEKVKEVLQGQVVLVTGGGGSIGSELCRQIIRWQPKTLIILDIYENNAYDLQMELLQQGISKEQMKVIIASIRDDKKLREVFEKYHPDLIFHAAAHKHVPLMEESPSEAIKNNIFGTFNVARCAVDYKVKKFIMVSTDKAVNPTNVMGATKRVCEMIIQSINETTPYTDFVAVRFGNVLGSNGSVIPLFKKQLEAGGPLTVTHKDIIRYFMTIPEAVRLILEATTFATGGEIFVLDMGKPVKILDLAKNFIKLSGLELGEDIEIKFTGLRPGEKLYEELLMEEEGLGKTQCHKIFIGKPTALTYEELMEQLQELQQVLDEQGDLRKALMKIVPTYKLPSYANAPNL